MGHLFFDYYTKNKYNKLEELVHILYNLDLNNVGETEFNTKYSLNSENSTKIVKKV